MPVNAPCGRCGKNMKRGSDTDYCQACTERYSPEELSAFLQFEKPLCQQCGKVVEWAMPCHMETGRTQFCSRACHNLAMSKIKEGDWPEIVRLYRDEHLTSNQIGKRYGCAGTVILKGLRRFDVLRYAKPGVANGMYGKTHTPAARQKIIDANNRHFSNPAARARQAETTIKQIQEGRTGKAYNKLETIFASLLSASGIKYQPQYRLSRFLYDFYLPQAHALIEVHGTFWHADPRRYDHTKLRPAQVRNVANDLRKEDMATSRGFAFMKFWEHDIHSNPDQITSALLDIFKTGE